MNRLQRIGLWANGFMFLLAALPFGMIALGKGGEESLEFGLLCGALTFVGCLGAAAFLFWGAYSK